MWPNRINRGAVLAVAQCVFMLAVPRHVSWSSEDPGPMTSPRLVTVVADAGRFGSVEHAAAAEDSVDWWDSRSEDDDACTESFAAIELARFLSVALGPVRVSLAGLGPLPPEGQVVVVGGHAAESAGISRKRPTGGSPDAFKISSSRREGRTVVVIDGTTRTGTLAGAYAVLEELGLRFFDLGDSNVVMAEPPGVLSSLLSREESPSFATRGFWAWEPRGSTDFFLWMARNRMNIWTAAEPRAALLEKLGIRLTAGGHGIESEFLNPDSITPGERRTRFAIHPEWYGFENGKRVPGISAESGLNFCTSNHAAVAELARGLIASLQTGAMRHADIVQLWPLDGGRWCQCESCRAIGSPQDRWLRVIAEVKRELKTVGRPVTIVSPAYLETANPPERAVDPDLGRTGSEVAFFPYFRCYAHPLSDPACEVNAPIEERLRGWSAGAKRPYQGELALGEYFNVSWTKSLPFVHPRVMATDLRDWSALGIHDFFTMHVPTRLWGTWTFEHAMLARLLWNPRANVDSLISDFCAREYGPASEDMRAFYGYLEHATANLLALQDAVGSVGFGERQTLLDPSLPIFRIGHLSDAPLPVADSSTSLAGIEASLRAARSALDSGRSRTRDPRIAARLYEVNARFHYGEDMLTFWIALIRAAEAVREGRLADLRAQVAVADTAAADLREVTDLVQVAASHANARDGFEASRTTRVYRWLKALAATAR